MDLLTEIRDIASRGNQMRIDFDNSLSVSDILNLIGLIRNNFKDCEKKNDVNVHVWGYFLQS